MAIDFTQLEQGSGGIENVLVMTDIYTKFTQAIPTKDQIRQQRLLLASFLRNGFSSIAHLTGYTVIKAGTSKVS